MPPFNNLAAAVLESVIPGVVFGIALVLAVSLVLKILSPVNAATRALVWAAALIALPLLPLLYLASHIPNPAAPVAQAAAMLPITHYAQPIGATQAPQAAKISRVTSIAQTRELSPINISIAQDLPAALLTLYGVIVVLLLLRLAISYIRLCSLRRHTEPAPGEIADRLQHWLIRCPTQRPVELRLSDQARSPLAIGWLKPIIVMPSALVLELSRQDFDDLGVHELAHIRRYDDWISLLQRLLEAVLFFHPAAYYVGRKLNLEREIACDDWVVSAHESRSYARCLAKVVETRRYQRGTLLLSSGAFFGKRQILARVESLLDRTRNSTTRVSSFLVIATAVMLAAIVVEVSNLPSVIAFTQNEIGSTHLRYSDDSRDLKINYEGEINFTPDEQSVASISPSGFLIIDESKRWSHRRLEVRPGPAGTPEETYFIDGSPKAFDGVGRAWAAGAYLFLLRDVGIDSDERVKRILARRGVAGVLEEVDLIHSDHVKSEYLNHLLEQPGLTVSDLQRLADCARKISSDNDKAEFLLAHRQELAIADVRSSYFRAVDSINSDNDRKRVLTALLETDGQSPETVRLVSLSAKGMDSDNDKADVLLAIPSVAAGETHCALLKAAQTIHSDNDKARVLHDTGYVDSTVCRDAYFAVVNLIESDNDRSNVLQNLLNQPKLESATYQEIAASAKAIHSDNDKANVLTPLSAHYTEAPFFDAVNTIESSNDRARVLQAVLTNAPTTAVLLQSVQSASTLSGDNEKTEVLLAIAKQSSDPNVRTALAKACGQLGSDNDYRRLASVLFEHSL